MLSVGIMLPGVFMITIMIKGRVFNASNNQPLEFCSISIQGTNTGSMSQDKKAITVTGKNFTLRFDKVSGLFSSICVNGTEMLAAEGSPRLNLWRAPHRNDDMWANKGWEENGLRKLQWQVLKLQATQKSPSTVTITASLEGIGQNGFKVTHGWRA